MGTSSYVPFHSGGPVWLDANFKIHTTQTAAGNRANELSSWWMIIWEPKIFLFLLAILREHLLSHLMHEIFSMNYVPSKFAVFSFHDKLYCNIVNFIYTGCPINMETRSTWIFSFCIIATAKVKPLPKSLDPNLQGAT